jgi:DNA ligase-1
VGRKQFQKCVSIVRRSDTDKHDFEEWKQVKYLVFDAPSLKQPFEERLKYLQSLAQTVASPYLSAHQHCICQGTEQLNSELQRVNDLGGEGLMLRQPGSLYEFKRSRTLLKVKSFHDAEAVVILYEPGHGKNEGLVGALRVRTSDGREFKVGTGLTDADRRDPPAIGARITYKFQELTEAGIPRFPSFLRVNPEL